MARTPIDQLMDELNPRDILNAMIREEPSEEPEDEPAASTGLVSWQEIPRIPYHKHGRAQVPVTLRPGSHHAPVPSSVSQPSSSFSPSAASTSPSLSQVSSYLSPSESQTPRALSPRQKGQSSIGRASLTTRSQCKYNKISLKLSDDGPRVMFVVPGCSLWNCKHMREEDIQQHGDATLADMHKIEGDIEQLDISGEILSNLKLLVGVNILRELDIFYLPQDDVLVCRRAPRTAVSLETRRRRSTSIMSIGSSRVKKRKRDGGSVEGSERAASRRRSLTERSSFLRSERSPHLAPSDTSLASSRLSSPALEVYRRSRSVSTFCSSTYNGDQDETSAASAPVGDTDHRRVIGQPERNEADQVQRLELRDCYNRLQDALPTTSQKSTKRNLLERTTLHVKHLEVSGGQLGLQIQSAQNEVQRLRHETIMLMVHATDSRREAVLDSMDGTADEVFCSQEGIDWLSQTLDLLEPASSIYARGVRRLRRFCRYTNLVPTSCKIPQPVYNMSPEPISETPFSDVMRGLLDGRAVAVKILRLRGQGLEEVRQAYLHELVMWRCLRHENIVPFIGTASELNVSLVSEWMSGGTIDTFLRNQPDGDRHRYVEDVVKGLTFMHSLDIVHGDLKATNILIDDVGRARITDFGLATVTYATMTATTSGTGGSIRWMAPELLDPDLYVSEVIAEDIGIPTKKSDMYALAITAWEIFSGELPFLGLRDAQVMKSVLQGVRPPFRPEYEHRGLNDVTWAQITHWWAPSPSARPLLSRPS